MNLIYSTLLSVFLFSFAVGYFVNRFVLKKSLKYNLKKSNVSAIRWENQSKPNFGGISFYFIFILVIIYYIFSFGNLSNENNHLLAFILVITLSFFMGLADDLLSTSPYFKFIVQFINASILIYFGIFIQVSNTMWFNYLLTYLWVIGIMNSINMLDNIDAISTLVTIVVLICVILITFSTDQLSGVTIFITTATVGALLSFLIFFNWNPSKMYMGDNGSQFIGGLLAIIGILFFWNSSKETIGFITLKPVIATVLVFLIPIVDTATVTINRLSRGNSPFVGGKDHTTHHLSYAGLSDRAVVIVLRSL